MATVERQQAGPSSQSSIRQCIFERVLAAGVLLGVTGCPNDDQAADDLTLVDDDGLTSTGSSSGVDTMGGTDSGSESDSSLGQSGTTTGMDSMEESGEAGSSDGMDTNEGGTTTGEMNLEDACIAMGGSFVSAGERDHCWVMGEEGESCDQVCDVMSMPMSEPAECDPDPGWNDDDSCSVCKDLLQKPDALCAPVVNEFAPFYFDHQDRCFYRENSNTSCNDANKDAQRVCRCS